MSNNLFLTMIVPHTALQCEGLTFMKVSLRANEDPLNVPTNDIRRDQQYL